MPYLSALEVSSRQGAIQIHVYLTLPYLLQAKCIFLIEIGRFAFLRLPLGDLGATYDDHLRLIKKRVVNFLLALIELFSLGVTAEELRAIIG